MKKMQKVILQNDKENSFLFLQIYYKKLFYIFMLERCKHVSGSNIPK